MVFEVKVYSQRSSPPCCSSGCWILLFPRLSILLD